MEWLNLSTGVLRSEDFLGCHPIDRATWLCLLSYCALQENGGLIIDCSIWGDGKWQQVVGVKKKEVTRTCELWEWDGDNLIVHFYPLDQERRLLTKRENGGKGGRPKKTERKPNQEPKPKPNQEPNAEPKQEICENVKEGKGKEWKGIGMEGKEKKTRASRAVAGPEFTDGNGNPWRMSPGNYAKLVAWYPNVDIDATLAELAEYCAAHPEWRRSASGMWGAITDRFNLVKQRVKPELDLGSEPFTQEQLEIIAQANAANPAGIL